MDHTDTYPRKIKNFEVGRYCVIGGDTCEIIQFEKHFFKGKLQHIWVTVQRNGEYQKLNNFGYLVPTGATARQFSESMKARWLQINEDNAYRLELNKSALFDKFDHFFAQVCHDPNHDLSAFNPSV